MIKKNYILVFFLLATTLVHAADIKIVIDSLKIESGQLLVNFHIDGLLNDKTIEGLKRGFTSEIVHHVQLWRRKTLFSKIVAEAEYDVKIYYDNWEDKFAIITESERRLTSRIGTVRKMFSYVSDFPLADSTKLDENATYYVAIKTKFQPISDETYQDLRNWIAGDAKKNEKAQKAPRRKGRLFGVLVDLIGFGDKTFSLKTGDFRIKNHTQINFLK